MQLVTLSYEQFHSLVDRLRGTTLSLDAVLLNEYGTPFENLSPETLERFDENLFECEVCGWWCAMDAVSETTDGVCDECASDDEDA